MSFHVVTRPRSVGMKPYTKYVSARLTSYGKDQRAHVVISGDLLAHLCARPGDFVRPLIGFGEDQGDFALERVNSRRDGYTLLAQPWGRASWFTIKASNFVPLTPGLPTVFHIELVEGRVICRAPAALAQAAE